MKKYLLAGLVGLSVLSACDSKNEMWGPDAPGANQGTLQLQLKNNAASVSQPKQVASRADYVASDNGNKLGVFAAEEVNVQNYTLTLSDSDGASVKSGLVSALGGNNGLISFSNLANGQYNVVAQNYDGSQVNVSTRPWFRGATSLSILPGKTTEATVTCRLQNIETQVVLSESFKLAFRDDYTVTIDNGESAVQIINKDNIQNKYYFAVPTQKDYITVSVKATTVPKAGKESNTITRTYTVRKPADAEGNNSYLAAGDALLINLTEDGSMLSHIDFGMTVDFSFAEQEEIFTISTDQITYDESQAGGEEPSNPTEPSGEAITFTGLPAAYTNPHTSGQQVVVNMTVPAGIKNINVTIRSTNENFASTIQGLGMGQTFDLVNPGDLYDLLSDPFDEGLSGLGLRGKDPIEGLTSYTFDVTGFMKLLPVYGANVATFSIEVVDRNGERKSGDLVVTIQ